MNKDDFDRQTPPPFVAKERMEAQRLHVGDNEAAGASRSQFLVTNEENLLPRLNVPPT